MGACGVRLLGSAGKLHPAGAGLESRPRAPARAACGWVPFLYIGGDSEAIGTRTEASCVSRVFGLEPALVASAERSFQRILHHVARARSTNDLHLVMPGEGFVATRCRVARQMSVGCARCAH